MDRSGAYMGRYIAKNVVAAGLAPVCEVQIAYCIGVADPVSVLVSSQGTSEIPDEVLTKAVREVFDMRPYFITKRLDLKRPIYSKTSCYGHFGRELPEFTWEKTAKERERPSPASSPPTAGTGVCGLPCRSSCRAGMRQTSYRLRLRPAAMPQGIRPGQDTGLPRALASGLQLASPVRIKYIERLRMP